MPLGLHPGTYPDTPDSRDRRFRSTIRRLPRRVDLSAQCGPVYNQRHIMSCSANAIAGALMLIAQRNDEALRLPSRLFMYYNARDANGAQRSDARAWRKAIRAKTTGVLKPPKAGTTPVGGHALLVVGYDAARGDFHGFFWVDGAYFSNPELSYDFRRIRSVVAAR